MSDFEQTNFGKLFDKKLLVPLDADPEGFIAQTKVPPIAEPYAVPETGPTFSDFIREQLHRTYVEKLDEALSYLIDGSPVEYAPPQGVAGIFNHARQQDGLSFIPNLDYLPVLEAEQRFAKVLEPHGIRPNTPLYNMCRSRAGLPPLIESEIVDE